MLTEEVHSAGVADDKIAGHEDAAHEKRNWVRLTFDCNNRCVFCLDSDTHDGEMRDRDDVKQQILDGRRKSATRLILSGGEPTIHPNYIDFIRLGARSGYRKIQTVTNGRLFSYPEFLHRCLDAGLSEITFSLHGPNAKIHDALVGVKGAFEQETLGLKNAIADGRPVVNVDIVINRANVKHLCEMLDLFISFGVREFDLLQVVPFGRAFTEGRDTLFYDLEELRPYLLAAFEYSKRDDLHIWFNRFPPQHLEGFERLIQDPYKLNDEVRGRKEEFARLLDEGTALDCRDPARCKYCYLEKLCDTLEGVRAHAASREFAVVRVDTEWEAKQEPVFGGDPASAKRAIAPPGPRNGGAHGPTADAAAANGPTSNAAATNDSTVNGAATNGPTSNAAAANGPTANGGLRPDGRRGLPIYGGGQPAPTLGPDELRAEVLWLRAPSVARAVDAAARFPHARRVELELDEYRGLDGKIAGLPVVRAIAKSRLQAEKLLELGGDFEIVVELSHETAGWLLALPSVPPRIAVRQPTYERLTESAERDVDLRAFFARLPAHVPVEDVPACVAGRAPRERPTVYDTAMAGADDRLEIFRYTKRYILDHYFTKSLRCKSCVSDGDCRGLHVNYVRAHGYDVMQPITAAE